MKYDEYRNKRQEEFNKLPIFYAFSDKQLEDALAERGLTIAQAKGNIYKLGYSGGFYLKADAPIIRAYFGKDHNKELLDIMNNDAEFAREAFVYEMYNHEYPINWEGDYDVASCFGTVDFAEEKSGADYLREMGYNDTVIGQWYSARKEVMNGDW